MLINPPMTDGQAWDRWRTMINHPAYGEGWMGSDE